MEQSVVLRHGLAVRVPVGGEYPQCTVGAGGDRAQPAVLADDQRFGVASVQFHSVQPLSA